MANILSLGGGDRGGYLELGAVPDATFITEIAALITAGTAVIGKLVSWTWSNNYEVTSPAESAIFDGKIVRYKKAASSYQLTIRCCSYIDQNNNRHTPVCILNVPYTGTFNLQDSVVCNSTTYYVVKDGGTGGWGACISKDVPASGYADVIF